jgi:hypothetical protein
MDIDQGSMVYGRMPFSNFVGVVHHSGPEAERLGFEPGLRVASIIKWGSNSKYGEW